jgi:hypothetical protein
MEITMTRSIGIGLAAIAAATIGASPIYAAEAARTASAQPCSPSTAKIDGSPAVSYCGPATATLLIGGKTYTFKDGFCQSIKVSGIKLDVTLGTIAEGKTGSGVPGNAGKPYFRLDISPGEFSSLLSPVSSGGKKLTGGATVSYSGSVTSKGTFKGMSGTPFSGSWNCHGVFVKN